MAVEWPHLVRMVCVGFSEWEGWPWFRVVLPNWVVEWPHKAPSWPKMFWFCECRGIQACEIWKSLLSFWERRGEDLLGWETGEQRERRCFGFSGPFWFLWSIHGRWWVRVKLRRTGCRGSALGLYTVWWFRKDWGICAGQRRGQVVLWEENWSSCVQGTRLRSEVMLLIAE